eukprot:9466644-Pyramimonas_sp.AAC.1
MGFAWGHSAGQSRKAARPSGQGRPPGGWGAQYSCSQFRRARASGHAGWRCRPGESGGLPVG